MEKIAKNYLKVLQNPPVNNKDTSEDISKVVKLPWIPIIGPKLRQAFKKKNIKIKAKLLPSSYPGVYVYVRATQLILMKLRKRY